MPRKKSEALNPGERLRSGSNPRWPPLGWLKAVTLVLEGLGPSSFHQNVSFGHTNIFYYWADDVRLHLISIISDFRIINELFSIGDNSASRPPTASIQRPMDAF